MKVRIEYARAACGWLAVALLGGLFAGAARPAKAAEGLLNRKAPQFARRDLNGRTVNLARLRGKVVLLNFWATWCTPCATEMPIFSQWQREYGGRGLQVIGVSMDDDEEPVKRLVARLKPEYPIAMGDARLGKQYGGVLGLPLTYLIDPDGVVRGRFQGSTDLRAMEVRVKELLAKP